MRRCRRELTIGEVQGPTGDSEDGSCTARPSHRRSAPGRARPSPSAASSRRGRWPAPRRADQNGFFLQSTPATADGDPTTSDGIFVFLGGFTTLIGGYTPTVGDEIVTDGRVSEFFNLTELSSARSTQVLTTTLDVDAVTPPFDADPPADLADAYRYWERREGMRGTRAGGQHRRSTGATCSRHGRRRGLGVARGDSRSRTRTTRTRGGRSATRTRSTTSLASFRQRQRLPDPDGQPRDQGGGGRQHALLIAPARTFDTLTNAPAGGVYFSFGKYSIQVDGAARARRRAPTRRPTRRREPSPAPRSTHRETSTSRTSTTTATIRTTAATSPATRAARASSPPFDYVPASDAAYQQRLRRDRARRSQDDLHSPDMVLVQEAEDQDICAVSTGALECGTADNADGSPDTLQELALRIAALGGPAYAAAYDRDGADDRGIVCGVPLPPRPRRARPVAADDPVFGSAPQVEYRGAPLPSNTDVQNPKALNAVLPADVDLSTGVDGTNVFTRAPQVGHVPRLARRHRHGRVRRPVRDLEPLLERRRTRGSGSGRSRPPTTRPSSTRCRRPTRGRR